MPIYFLMCRSEASRSPRYNLREKIHTYVSNNPFLVLEARNHHCEHNYRYVLIVHAETRGKREEESFVLHRGLLEVSQPVHVRRYRQGSPQPCPELYAVYKLSFRTGSSSLSVTALHRPARSLTPSLRRAIRIEDHVPRPPSPRPVSSSSTRTALPRVTFFAAAQV